MVSGILAHVDAGKTTLSEALLYRSGAIRSLGRVDHGDAYLDTDAQERARGITIFSKQARLTYEDMELTLLDTPGHVDFSAEMERTLSCLDYAILVVSGASGVQGHTRTLWKLLRHYDVPAFIFVNKMDQPGTDRDALMQELKEELSDTCVDVMGLFGRGDETPEEVYENLAVCDETMLEKYMEEGMLEDAMIADAIAHRKLFPCFFGWALPVMNPVTGKKEPGGVDELLEGLYRFAQTPDYPQDFAARVYKIGRDARGARLTHMKITGGSLKVRERLEYRRQQQAAISEEEDEESTASTDGLVIEKVDQIRKYSGEKFETVDLAKAGDIVAVTGLTGTFPGQGLGAEADIVTPVLEPVLNYQLILPREISPLVFMEKMRILEEEDPKLKVVWKPEVKEIHVQLMGLVQMEVLQQLIKDRFGVLVTFGPGSIVYKETITRPVEGVGHFEPLRHYAEAHILLSPGEPGSGIVVDTLCSEDVLDRNWQRLIATHVEERIHRGVLIGAALTDVRMTIVTGRAHPKHTEGGDFRQATYRAVRQGLKSTSSILLEPYYQFLLEIPMEHVGRALTDLEKRFAKVGTPEFVTKGSRDMAILRGSAPAATMQDYISEVHAYTQGLGALMLEVSGYDVCHNQEEVIAKYHYDSELDFRNPTGSVFCAHGSGYVVPWDEVPANMHMEYVFPPEKLAALWESGLAKAGEPDGMEVSDAIGANASAGGIGAEACHNASSGEESKESKESSAKGSSAKDASGMAWLKAGLAGGMNYSHAGKGFSSEDAESLSGAAGRRSSWEKSVSRMSEVELDAELADVYAREFGMSKSDMEEQERRKWAKKKTNGIPEGLSGKPRTVKHDRNGNPIYPKADNKKDFLIVDGYNIIFSWEELNELQKVNIDAAREKLVDILSNYQGYKRCRLAVVFDAYKRKDNGGKQLFYDGVSRKMTTLKAAREKAALAMNAKNAGSTNQAPVNPAKVELPQGIEIIYTRTDELADARIERMVHDNKDRYRITVATNDGLEQLTILSQGALRMPAKELQQEIEREERKCLEEFQARNRK